jgi:hypothetical protein
VWADKGYIGPRLRDRLARARSAAIAPSSAHNVVTRLTPDRNSATH